MMETYTHYHFLLFGKILSLFSSTSNTGSYVQTFMSEQHLKRRKGSSKILRRKTGHWVAKSKIELDTQPRHDVAV